MLELLRLCLSLFMLSVSGVFSKEYCELCETGVEGLKRPHFNVNPHGKTCVKLALETALMEPPGTNDCDDIIEDFREFCCGDEEPSPIEQAPTSSPVYYTGGSVSFFSIFFPRCPTVKRFRH